MRNRNIAFITGATAGIGEATAHILAKKGYPLIINGRRRDRLEKLADTLSKEYKNPCLALPFDIRDREAISEAISSLPDEWSDIEILVNNAGLAAGLDTVHEADWDDWEQMVDTNLKGLINITRLITPSMVERKSGHIINITSIAGKEVYNKGSVYCASKHAVDAFSKGLRIDLVPYNIKVTSVAPGAVNTEFSTVRFKGDREKADQVYVGFDPLLAEDIAEAILFVITRPAHVNINDLLIMPTAQANASTLVRKDQ
jgi:NADP-dependent 3-hydroxy acid dehydrogenase YdfG